MGSPKTRIAPDDDRIREAIDAVGRGVLSGKVRTTAPPRTTTLSLSVDLRRPPPEVLDFCLRREGFTSIMPDPIRIVRTSTPSGELGGTYVFTWWFKNVVPVRWAAFIDSHEPGREFSDIQLRGIFRYFHHTHTCEPAGAGTRYTDTIRFAGPWGHWVDRKVLLPQLKRTFRERHRRMRLLLEASGA